MGTVRSIGRVLCDDLRNVSFSDIRLMSRTLSSKPQYRRLSKAAVLNILDPLYYKARYCRGPREESPEGIYAITAPDEAFVFSASMIHSTNYFPPASEQRTSAIIRAHRRQDVMNEKHLACYYPGSTHSGVDLDTRRKLNEQREERIDHFYELVFGYEGVRRRMSILAPMDTAMVDALRQHYERAAAFFAQEAFALTPAVRGFVRDFFREDCAPAHLDHDVR